MAIAASFWGPNYQFLDDDGVVLAGGFVYFYSAGTSTPLDTYTDAALTPGNENTNPIELDAAGRSSTSIYLQAAGYKVVVKDANLVTLWTRDDYAVKAFS